MPYDASTTSIDNAGTSTTLFHLRKSLLSIPTMLRQHNTTHCQRPTTPGECPTMLHQHPKTRFQTRRRLVKTHRRFAISGQCIVNDDSETPGDAFPTSDIVLPTPRHASSTPRDTFHEPDDILPMPTDIANAGRCFAHTRQRLANI